MARNIRGVSVLRWVWALSGGVLTALVLTVTAANAQTSHATQRFDIPAGSLIQALDRFGEQSGLQVVYSTSLLNGKTAAAVHGKFSSTTALQHLLQSSGLTYNFVNASTVKISKASRRRPPPRTKAAPVAPVSAAPAQQEPVRLATVAVTGSHIAGATQAAPVINISQQQMIDAGQTNLGEVIRSVPQNFSGGQNPGVGQGAGGINNQNITGGSAVDLFGLGPDSTLTLLNGQRLAYDGFGQGVDIAQIPLAAVDHIQIVTGGASAIYGSDAVAGVVNVILKPDYNGFSATARIGEATSGGDVQHQYGVVGGTTWSTGGFIAAAEYETDSGIASNQRNYTSYLPTPYTLIPPNQVSQVIFNGHQNIGTLATFTLISTLNLRNTNSIFNESSVVYADISHSNEFTVSPSLTFSLPGNWEMSMNTMYGRDDNTSHESAYQSVGEQVIGDGIACFCNTTKSYEIGATGPIFKLPAGLANLATGFGYHRNTFLNNTSYSFPSPAAAPVFGQQHDIYAYGELNLPVVSPTMGIHLVRDLSVDLALRHDHYNVFGSVTTPRVGIFYAPDADIDLKASWGKSFKAPTLIELYEPTYGFLWPIQMFGIGGYPGNATALMSYGGNPMLSPERSTDWSATVEVHPRALPEFHSSISYLHIDYRDKVAQGVTNISAAFTDPAYADFLNLIPTESQKQKVLDMAGTANFRNYAGAPYDSANVVAIIDDLFENISYLRSDAVSWEGSYRFQWGANNLVLSGNASWLISRQRSTSDAPFTDLAGTIFNPPHFKSRLGAIWQHGPLTLATYYNFIGGVSNTLVTPMVHTSSMDTVDMTLRYNYTHSTDIGLSINNLANKRPPYADTLSPFKESFDSTNYSPIGRFISLTFTTKM